MFDALRELSRGLGITYWAGYEAGKKVAIEDPDLGPYLMVPEDPKPANKIWEEIVGEVGRDQADRGCRGMAFLRDYIFGDRLAPIGGSGVGMGLENNHMTTPESLMEQYLDERGLPLDTDFRLALMVLITEVDDSLSEFTEFMGQLGTDISDVDWYEDREAVAELQARSKKIPTSWAS
jgi:hypothetical protein